MADFIESEKNEEESGGLDLATIWTTVILYWPWIVFSTIIALCLAFAYLKYTRPVYSTSMKVLVKDDDSKKFGSGQMTLENMGLISNSNGFDNEVEILGSTNLCTRVVKNLKLYTSYFQEGTIRKQELYKDSPVIVDMTEEQLDKLESIIKLEISKKGENDFKIKGEIILPEIDADPIEFEQKTKTISCTMNTPVGTLILQPNPGYEMDERTMYVTLTPPVMAGRNCVKNLSVAATSKTTTVAEVTYTDTQIKRALDFLTELFDSYNQDANEDKNEVARKTEVFINERIEAIRNDLNLTEEDLETYKKKNELTDLETDAKNAQLNTNEYHKLQVELQTQLVLVNGLVEHMNNPANYLQVLPVSLGLQKESLTSAITKYNELVQQRNHLLKYSGEDNPTVKLLTTQLEEAWPNIKLSLETIKNDVVTQKKSAERQFSIFTGRISNAPTQERAITNITRQQEIQAGLYLLLLEKREENYISLASTASKARIIDSPKYDAKISPKTPVIGLFALMLGMMFPIGIVYLSSLLRYRIEGREDVEKLTRIPILADIPQSNESSDQALLVRENSNNMMEEAFRGLRTNTSFILEKDEKVLLCSSCIPGEGKTFIASNLAMSLALMGKKVILIGLDIRKPRLVRLFKLPPSQRGIVNFLRTENGDFELLDNQIYKAVCHKNLDIMPSGTIPPNPGELVSRPQLNKAVELLREHYDYIILDTPPVGLVSDTLTIGRVADLSFIVVRADYSLRSNFTLINNIKADRKLPKVNLVLNGVDLKKKKYGYYYGYGRYGRYGHYGTYGSYGNTDESGMSHTEN